MRRLAAWLKNSRLAFWRGSLALRNGVHRASGSKPMPYNENTRSSRQWAAFGCAGCFTRPDTCSALGEVIMSQRRRASFTQPAPCVGPRKSTIRHPEDPSVTTRSGWLTRVTWPSRTATWFRPAWRCRRWRKRGSTTRNRRAGRCAAGRFRQPGWGTTVVRSPPNTSWN